MRFALILGMAGALAGLPCLAQTQRDPDAAGVAEAIRFEKAKQAAADRQARIEAHAANPAEPTATGSKTRKKPVKSAAVRKPAPPR